MAQLKDQQTGADGDNFTVGGNLSVTGTTALTNALAVTSGGTGVSTVTTGDILYASSVNTLAKLAGAGTTGQALLSGTAPSWGKVELASAVSGTLPVANGGTGATSLTDKSVLVGSGTSAVIGVAPGVDDNVLMSDGTSWTSAQLSTMTAFDKSHVTNGYQKLPGGLIIQWGTYDSTSDSAQTFNFPIEFTTSCLNMSITLIANNTKSSIPVSSFTKTSFVLNRDSDFDGTVPLMMMAIGF
jgi:hypothetical protein